MKKMALVLTLSMISVVLPIDLPLCYLSSQAFADDSGSVIAGDAKSKMTPSAIPTAIAATNQIAAEGAVSKKNEMDSMMGKTKSEESGPSALLALEEVVEPEESNPAVEEPTKQTPVDKALQDMKPHLIKFTAKYWSIMGRKKAQQGINEKMRPLIGVLLATGGDPSFGLDPKGNLVIKSTYPDLHLTLTLTVFIKDGAGNNPKPDDVDKKWDFEHPLKNIIDAMRLITSIMNGVNNVTG